MGRGRDPPEGHPFPPLVPATGARNPLEASSHVQTPALSRAGHPGSTEQPRCHPGVQGRPQLGLALPAPHPHARGPVAPCPGPRVALSSKPFLNRAQSPAAPGTASCWPHLVTGCSFHGADTAGPRSLSQEGDTEMPQGHWPGGASSLSPALRLSFAPLPSAPGNVPSSPAEKRSQSPGEPGQGPPEKGRSGRRGVTSGRTDPPLTGSGPRTGWTPGPWGQHVLSTGRTRRVPGPGLTEGLPPGSRCTSRRGQAQTPGSPHSGRGWRPPPGRAGPPLPQALDRGRGPPRPEGLC